MKIDFSDIPNRSWLVKGVEDLAGYNNYAADFINKEHKRLYVPIKERNVIVLEPDQSLANAYIGLFASGKAYSNSTKFSKECYNGEVLEGLVNDNPIVLITSVRLPIKLSGKFDSCCYEDTEGINMARQVRAGFGKFPRDVPVLFYSSTNLDKEARKDIKTIQGVTAYIARPYSMNPDEKNIQNILFIAADSMFKRKYKNLIDSVKALDEACLTAMMKDQ
jgi:hypothetical protein